MNPQATLELTPAPQGPAVDPIGFHIGWDHARHALVPPPELLASGTPISQGWLAARAVFGQRTLTANRNTRQWLALRLQAWRTGIAFETEQLTPHHLAQIQTERCPVLRTPLAGATGEPESAVVERLNPHGGYAAGNVAVISQRAALARRGVGIVEALRRGHRADATEGLEPAAWTRLAVLQSFATPLSFGESARLPLALLPPNRVRVLNAAQGLQTLLTLQFAAPGWSARTRAVADMLPEHTLRHDWNLFVGAIAPRVLEAGDGVPVRTVLEDAWLHERVQRRWQHVVLSLGEAGTAALLDRAVAQGLAGVHTLQHGGVEQATEGWALDRGGRVQRTARRDAATAAPAWTRRVRREHPQPQAR
jgi:hypothetical protein